MRKREDWRRQARDAAFAYPRLRRELAELRRMSVTPRLGGSGRGGGDRRGTEDVALRQLAPGDQAALEAVEKALRMLRALRTADKRRRLAELVYFRRTHTILGAGVALGVSEETARQWDRDFLWAIFGAMSR